MLPILLLVLFFSVVGGGVFLVVHQIKKTDPNNQDTSAVKDIKTAQEFLPFNDIKNGMIDLGGHDYRSIIEVNSINYDLRTHNERAMINSSFQRFLNSLTSDITIYIQTKRIDMSDMLQTLQKDTEEIKKTFPHLENYSKTYEQDMMGLTERIGNNLQKKKYIIVSFNEAMALTDLSDEEKYEYSAREIYLKSNIIVDGLTAVGLKATILRTDELADVLYSAYNRSDSSQIKNIVNGEYMSTIVEAEDDFTTILSDRGKIDNILYETLNSLQGRIKDENTSKEVKAEALEIFKNINKLRESFKEDEN